jgi:hypothetical protein
MESPRVEFEHVYHIYSIRVQRQNYFSSQLKSELIGHGFHYPLAVHQQPYYREKVKRIMPLLNAENLSSTTLSLPIFPGMTHEEIERAKGAVRGSLVLSQEDSGSRMSRIGKNEIVYGQVMDFDDILKSISRVNAEDIRQIASEFLVKTPTLALVGPFKNESKFEKVLGR